MKRALSLILCAVMLTMALVACTTLEKDPKTGDYDKGAIIPMYIGTQLFNFDPAVAYLNDSQAKILSLLYEGLTDIDENGKLILTLIDKYEIHDGLNEFGEEEHKMVITLKKTRWSDGRELTANDVVYAWKRILDVDYDSEAAALLYDIKNARAIKLGDKTIDDLGLKAPETNKVEIEFETSIDYQQFLRNLSSPALVPLRGDIVKKNPDWAKKPATIVTSGPFTIKRVTYNQYLRLERSSYYFLNKDKKEKLDKYVIPYRIEVDYSKSLEDILNVFNKGSIFYVDELSLQARKSGTYDKYVTVTDLMSTHAYYLNLNNELLKDARVRRALSLAIDREYVAKDIVVYARPATGFIPYKVMDTKVGTSFREAGGDLLSTKANMEEAKSLLKEAGVSGGELTIAYYKDDDVSAAIASYVKTVWEELGFTIKLRGLTGTENISDSSIYNDRFNMMYTVSQAQKGE
ncbi:MAG TPA: ABC transporter substrate-binding protein, partial [Bacillota bacterium]|nr:ABC transporter substrate-binding protein [Bacillota bacterium]